MKTKISQWGNSLGVRIPKSVAQELKLTDDMTVDVDAQQNKIIITPKPQSHVQELTQLMEGITPSKYYGEMDWGQDVGNEIIEW